MKTIQWKRGLSVAISAALLSACAGEVSGPGAYRQTGVLVISGWSGNVPMNLDDDDEVDWNRPPYEGDYTAPDVLVAPDTVTAGEPFEVTTNTVGWSGCWRSDGQTVAVLAGTVLIRPYDSHSGSEVCTDALVFLGHSSTVVIDEPGQWRLRVNGRRLRMGDGITDEPISAEKGIVVR